MKVVHFVLEKNGGRENKGIRGTRTAVSSTWQVQIKVSEAIPSALAGLNGFSSVGHHIIKHCNSGWEIQAASDVHWLLLSCLSAHTWPKVQESDINLCMERHSWITRGFYGNYYWKPFLVCFTHNYTHRYMFSEVVPQHMKRDQASPLDNMTWIELYYLLWQDSLLLLLLSVSFLHFCPGLSILWSVSLLLYLFLSIWGNITEGQRLC